MKKRFMTLLMILLLLTSTLSIFALPTAAKTSGVLTYSISNGAVTITDCDPIVSGTLDIPASLDGYPVTSIGSFAFDACTALQSIILPQGLTSIGVRAFQNCSSLQSIILPQGLTSIEIRAFLGCSSLQSIKIPEGVPSIGTETFYGCSSLQEVTLPVSVKTIEDRAFYFCDKIETVWYGGTPADRLSIEIDTTYGVPLTKVRWFYTYDETTPQHTYDHSYDPDCNTCGESRTSPLTLTFDEQTLAATVTACNQTERQVVVPATVTYNEKTYTVTAIGDRAFYDRFALESVSLPDTLTSIGEAAFGQCVALESIAIPKSVTALPHYGTFVACRSLKTVTLHDQITALGDSAFSDCRSLTDITLPKNLTTLGSQVFYRTKLSEITIPNGVTKLEDSAFLGCSFLESVTLPDSITTIKMSAFDHCPALNTVYFLGTAEKRTKDLSISLFNDPIKNANWQYKGDLNGDAATTSADVSALLKSLNTSTESLNSFSADCNNDGKISLTDALRLLKLINA